MTLSKYLDLAENLKPKPKKAPVPKVKEIKNNPLAEKEKIFKKVLSDKFKELYANKYCDPYAKLPNRNKMSANEANKIYDKTLKKLQSLTDIDNPELKYRGACNCRIWSFKYRFKDLDKFTIPCLDCLTLVHMRVDNDVQA